MADRLENAAADLQAASRWLLDKGAGGSDDGLAAATPYLRMFGTTVGGWLLARSAIAARRLLDDSGGAGDPGAGHDAAFCEAKIATARFYAGQILPQVHGLLPAVMAGADDLYAIDPATMR